METLEGQHDKVYIGMNIFYQHSTWFVFVKAMLRMTTFQFSYTNHCVGGTLIIVVCIHNYTLTINVHAIQVWSRYVCGQPV